MFSFKLSKCQINYIFFRLSCQINYIGLNKSIIYVKLYRACYLFLHILCCPFYPLMHPNTCLNFCSTHLICAIIFIIHACSTPFIIDELSFGYYLLINLMKEKLSKTKFPELLLTLFLVQEIIRFVLVFLLSPLIFHNNAVNFFLLSADVGGLMHYYMSYTRHLGTHICN